MPANDGLGMHNDKNTSPIGPESPQDDPEHPVAGSQTPPRPPGRQDNKLLTEGKVLQNEVGARSNTANLGQEEAPQHLQHMRVISSKIQAGRDFGEGQATPIAPISPAFQCAFRFTDSGVYSQRLGSQGSP